MKAARALANVDNPDGSVDSGEQWHSASVPLEDFFEGFAG